MACISTDATDNICCKVALLGTVELSVANLTTVLASLILVVTKCTVKCRKLTKLIALELVLTFWNRCSLGN